MSILITLAEAKEHLGITEDDATQNAFIQAMVDAVESQIEKICGIGLNNIAVTNEIHQGGGKGLRPFRYPVTSVERVVDQDNDDEVLVAPTPTVDGDYELNSSRWIVRDDRDRWPSGRDRWLIDYYGGYSSAPDGIRNAELMFIGYLWENRWSISSVTAAGMAMAMDQKFMHQILNPFKEQKF